MTTYQTQLIARLAEKKIEAAFRGCFLICRVKVTNAASQKVKWQKFSFAFDSPADCQGSRLLLNSLRGAYSEAHARKAAEIIFKFSAEIGQEAVA